MKDLFVRLVRLHSQKFKAKIKILLLQKEPKLSLHLKALKSDQYTQLNIETNQKVFFLAL